MRQASARYRVLAPTALFGTVRTSRGDIIRRELLGCNVRKLIELGIIEPLRLPEPARNRISLL